MRVKLSVVLIGFDFIFRAPYKLLAAGLACLLLLSTYAAPAMAKKKVREVAAESTERAPKVKVSRSISNLASASSALNLASRQSHA